ncbi:hypothetical protein JZ751_000997 [Albula glossodonta]|uniref:LCCL domain-containing protein n=1 Tax=Albula glossodonta TaxID=121402 RepID=A0A8T2PXW3_9TELE|nr:hypothetical protein JZ751_000997 [Albula glossodonta]
MQVLHSRLWGRVCDLFLQSPSRAAVYFGGSGTLRVLNGFLRREGGPRRKLRYPPGDHTGAQQVSCEAKLRDNCKGTTCNRYECPAGCLQSKMKVIGSGYYDMQSSICGAGIHAGIVDNEGGWLDITRVGRKEHFTKSNKNGVQTLGLYCPRNCLQMHSQYARVIGTRVYSDLSTDEGTIY